MIKSHTLMINYFRTSLSGKSHSQFIELQVSTRSVYCENVLSIAKKCKIDREKSNKITDAKQPNYQTYGKVE